MSFQKGSTLETSARYEIVDKLGEGNYGTVSLARHQEVDRQVAIKTLLCDKEKFSELQKEVWVQSRLCHPNIVSVYDFVLIEGKGCLIMEYVEKSLQRILEEYALRRKRVPLQFALKVIRGCLEGLVYAHDLGVVHGDIKPANILIDSDETPKLSDFGFARLMGTAVKTKKGSSRCAAPEVLKRWNTDGVWACDYQSDLFSLGVVAYLLLTGEHPFLDPSGTLPVESVILDEEILPPPPTREGEIIPERYALVTMKLIQRNRRHRYALARDSLGDLQRRRMSPSVSVFGDFENKARIEVIELLLNYGLMSLSEICRKLREIYDRKMTLPGLLKHMKELEDAGIVREESGGFLKSPDARKTVYFVQGKERVTQMLQIRSDLGSRLATCGAFCETSKAARSILGAATVPQPREKRHLEQLIEQCETKEIYFHLTKDEKKKLRFWRMMLKSMDGLLE